MQFTKEHMDFQEFEPYFGYGVHKVKILSFQAGTTDGGKDYIETFFTDEQGQAEDSARVWFSTDEAVEYSLKTLNSILVHNTPEDKKQEARDAFKAAKGTDELAELLNSKLVGGEMWFTKYQDSERTYEKEGKVYKSVNRNIHGYAPTPKPELIPQKDVDQESGGDTSHYKDVPTSEIPF